MSDQDDNTIVLGNEYGAGTGYISGGAGVDTITLDPTLWNNSITIPNGGTGYSITTGSITSPYTYTTTGSGSTVPNNGYAISSGTGYTWATGTTNTNTTVEINADGMKIKEGGDITIGGKSLSDAIEKIEERLGILTPNPELEERWEKLKELRKQYMEMEKDLLEKEKIMKILKES